MYLVRLIYASKVSADFEASDIENILTQAWQNNEKSDVSGVLCFSGEYFLQCLEGSRTTVNATYGAILNDPRHQDIVLLDYSEIIKREFSHWSMGYIREASASPDLLAGYSGSNAFKPFSMSGESAHQMLVDMGSSLPLAKSG